MAIARNVGVAADPVEGPEKIVFAVCETKSPVSVPVVVTGEPLTENTDTGSAKPTLVTEPIARNCEAVARYDANPVELVTSGVAISI